MGVARIAAVAVGLGLLVVILRAVLAENLPAVGPALERAPDPAEERSPSDPVELEPVGGERDAPRRAIPEATLEGVITTPATRGASRPLRGRLLRPDRGPTGPDHSVVLIELDDDGAPFDGGGRAFAELDPGGEFTLELPPWANEGRALLVGRAPEHAPATLVLGSRHGAPPEDVTLSLTAGMELRGRVLLHGEPLPGWPLSVDLRYGVPGVFEAGREGFWLDGRFVEKHAETRTDDDGSFRFTGLVADRYDLRCGRPGPALPGFYHGHVQVDGSEAVVELGGALLAVTALSSGGPLEGARIQAHWGTEKVTFTSGTDPVDVMVPPGATITLEAEHATHEAAPVDVVAGALGQRLEATVPMTPVTRPSLRVHLPGAFAAGVRKVEVDIVELRHGAETRRLGLEAGSANDTFELEILPASPGRHALRLRCIRDFRSEVVALYVPAEGLVEATFQGTLGGRISVDLSSSRPSFSALWSVEDLEGNTVVPHQHLSVSPEGSFAWSFGFDVAETVPRLEPLHDVLARGRYALVVESDGHLPHREEFEVAVGETTELSVALQPE